MQYIQWKQANQQDFYSNVCDLADTVSVNKQQQKNITFFLLLLPIIKIILQWKMDQNVH